ncbi:MAG: 50S ribosomal protein L32 [Bdellovibrionales bacterium CG10_big_fil_rev_8_21_14_0_10_45_34]|nr:MAG: 50S ribosomal protein L32 [Bdellovibrionales bacterium CG10_big_fil_rev_8_21_14_0_10_45_34]
MPTPKKKHTRSRTGQRRAHDALQTPTRSTCSNCNGVMVPHRVCPTCGYYRGKQVLNVGE